MNRVFRDDWEASFDKNMNRGMRAGIAIWLAFLILNLIFWGVAIWGVIEVVQWLTSK